MFTKVHIDHSPERKILSSLATHQAGREARDVIDIYKHRLETLNQLLSDDVKLQRALLIYNDRRRNIAVEIWANEDLEWCSKNDHLAPLGHVHLFLVEEWERHLGDRYVRIRPSLHRLCSDCQKHLSSISSIHLGEEGRIVSPDTVYKIYPAKIEEDGIYTRTSPAWIKTNLEVPKLSAFTIKKFSRTGVPPEIEVSSLKTHGSELTIGGVDISEVSLT